MSYEDEPRGRGPAAPMMASRVLPVLAIALAVVTMASLFYAWRAGGEVRQLTTSRDEMKTSLAQTRARLDELNGKLTQLAAQPKPQAMPVVSGEEANAAAAPKARRARIVRVPARRQAPARPDPRIKKLEDQLADQQKQIASTQDDVKKTRDELAGRLDSTREELSGSIARNHEEVVELQKRGERNFHEFTLIKSKQFQRTGPIGLSLRKADTKHKRFDVVLLVDDFQLEKKRVNLYEPVLSSLTDRPQPLELVVNQVDKNQVKGYLSEPKYRKSDLAATAAAKPQGLATR